MSEALRERVDVCVVGSGAGGSVVAYQAAKLGLSTLVLERGPRVSPKQMSDRELDMIPWLYKDGGLLLNSEMDLFILQGTCVGGSTVLSNMVMLRPDESVFDTWARLGAEVDRTSLKRCFDEVAVELDVAPPEANNISSSAHLFYAGAQTLGLHPKVMRKAVGKCKGCGYCNVGCGFGTKRDAANTYLRWAEALGARVMPETTVAAVRYERGRAQGVDARVGRGRTPLQVEAKIVVIAAGAIGSSALLLRSGIRRNVGTRVSFNAGGMMVAEFPQPIDAFDGDQVTVYLEGDGYVIEATHNPPMSAALTTPGWFSQHAGLMQRFRHLAYAGALVATEPVGRVVHSAFFGHEETRFKLTPRDMRTLKRGMTTIAEVFFAAGARRVLLPTHRSVVLDSAREVSRIETAFDSANQLSLGSAHPQGGNPISSDPRLGAVDETLRVHGFDNLYVCDASVFPTSIGVNPIHTIMALAKHHSAQMLAAA